MADSESFAKSRELKPSEVFDAATVPEGYLKCSVEMTWPWMKGRLRMVLVARKAEFNMHLLGPWNYILPSGTISPGDSILLDLRGAKVEKGKTPTLKYEDGFLIQRIISGPTEDTVQIIDGWQGG